MNSRHEQAPTSFSDDWGNVSWTGQDDPLLGSAPLAPTTEVGGRLVDAPLDRKQYPQGGTIGERCIHPSRLS